MDSSSNEGNLTTSISDHFSQFCELDTFQTTKNHVEPKYGRSYTKIVQDEFDNELKNINWGELFLNKSSNECLIIFLLLLKTFWMRWLQYKNLLK